ncbi:MAG: CARDB domain-containing protein [Chloroflexota bacterium]|nr:CARDB domain-containing protein [Chloroflexota bacterium]
MTIPRFDTRARRLWHATSLLILVLLAGCDLNAPVVPTPNTILSADASAITLASPLEGARYQAGVAVPIQALIRGADVTRVEIRLDGVVLTTHENTDSDAAFGVTQWWTADGDGVSATTARTISAIAYKTDGSTAAASAAFSVIGSLPTNTPTDTPMPTDAPLPTAARLTATLILTDSPTDAPVSTVAPRVIMPTDAATVAVTDAPLATLAATDTLSAASLLDLALPTVSGADTASPIPTRAETSAANSATPVPNETRLSPTNTPRATGVIATFTQNVNLRRGAGRAFGVVGVGEAGLRADVLAITPARDWYYVRMAGVYGWVFRDFVTLAGETSILPIDAGPATPSQTPTPAPTVPTIVPTVNLTAGAISLDPMPTRCNEPMLIRFEVANTGTQPTRADAIRVQDTRGADDSSQADVFVSIPALAPGQTIRVEIPLTISTWYNEEHRLTLTLDPGARLAESDEDDNRAEITYWLDQAACA